MTVSWFPGGGFARGRPGRPIGLLAEDLLVTPVCDEGGAAAVGALRRPPVAVPQELLSWAEIAAGLLRDNVDSQMAYQMSIETLTDLPFDKTTKMFTHSGWTARSTSGAREQRSCSGMTMDVRTERCEVAFEARGEIRR